MRRGQAAGGYRGGLTVGGLLDLVAERRPEDDALVYVDRGLRYSYARFNEAVERCARAVLVRPEV